MKKILVSLLSIMILMTAFPFVGRAEETTVDDVKMITVPFFSAGMWEMEWDFPYSDSYFLQSADFFSRDIAKASLGLTISAFREGGSSTVSNQYETYLGEAGFQNIYAFGYDQPTAPDTLSGVIASKKIGDFTLIAASPCGQGYEKEWGGNLNVGDSDRHEGFNIGAQVLEREILSYIEAQKLTGKLKLWISSFSRGAAVSNLAAADMTDSGIFEEVYAYLYAVPRTTRTEFGYPNICNICGAYDPVTQIPLESWGYFRYGWDLYLPSAETAAEYDELAASVDTVTQAVAHDIFRYNPELNYELHLIIEFLGEMFPDAGVYASDLQEEIMGLWTEADPDQLFQILETVFASLNDLDRRQEYSREVFLEYLDYVASVRLGDTRGSTALRDSVWASDQGMAANLMREHMPYIYLSWIFSDLTDTQLTEGSFSLHRLSVIGDVDVEIWQDDVLLNGLDRNGDVINTVSDRSVFAVRYGITTMVFIPSNDNFQVRIKTKDNTGFNYRLDSCYLPSTYGLSEGYHVALVTPGTYELRFLKYREEEVSPLRALEGIIRSDTVSDREYSPTLAMQILSEAENHVTVKGILTNAAIILIAVIVLLIVCLIIAIVHKKRKKIHGPYSPWYVIIPHFLLLILSVWLTVYLTEKLYLITTARSVFAAASGLILILLSLRGLIRNRYFPNILIMCIMLITALLNVFVYQQSQIVGEKPIINILYCLIMAVLAVLAATTFLIRRKRSLE